MALTQYSSSGKVISYPQMMTGGLMAQCQNDQWNYESQGLRPQTYSNGAYAADSTLTIYKKTFPRDVQPGVTCYCMADYLQKLSPAGDASSLP